MNCTAYSAGICTFRKDTFSFFVCVRKQLVEMPWRAEMLWALCHWKCHSIHREKAAIPHPPAANHQPNLLMPHTITLGYIIMPPWAKDTFTMPVVIRNKLYYTHRQWFMNIFYKGCVGSLSPSNPLISLKQRHREGEADGDFGGLCIWVERWCWSCRVIPAEVLKLDERNRKQKGGVQGAMVKVSEFPDAVNCLWNVSPWLH